MTDPSPKEAIFFAALEIPTAQARAAFLDQACAGDETLRHQVERLLASHAKVGGFLERPVQEVEAVAAAGAPDRPKPGDTNEGTETETGQPGDGPHLDFLAPSQRPDSLGRMGHYEVLQVLGHGGMGVVLRAFDEKLHRVVAIKVLAPALAALSPSRRRFVREARSAAAVIHDNVLAIYGVEDTGPVPYLIMPYISGPTLQQKIDRSSPLPVVEVLRLGMQIASGLAAAHAQGLVHRDVKPSNILLENGVERVKITDFGLARSVDEPAVTQPGVIAGTPAYMSPEQAAGEHVDHRSDLFSLGSVLYAMCTGYAPFRATSMVAVLKRVCETAPRPVRQVNPDVPEWLEALIATLHAKEPAGRPQTAAEVAGLLGRRLAELQQPSRTATSPDGGLQQFNHSRRPVSLWIAVAVLLTLGVVMTEATGVTNVRVAVVRLLLPDGTLVVEVDDPTVSVAIVGTDLVITGAGAKEIRLKPGDYQVRASKDGKVVRQELVTVEREGRQVVKISKESAAAPTEPKRGAPRDNTEPNVVPLPNDAERWERSVAVLPVTEQIEAVKERLKKLNPDFDGRITPQLSGGHVTHLNVVCGQVTDLSPVRGFKRLSVLFCTADPVSGGKLSDLTPLKGLLLTRFLSFGNPIADLEPLRGMPLGDLCVAGGRVASLAPLQGMPLTTLTVDYCTVSDLSALRGMPLTHLQCAGTKVSDLTPLEGMKLEELSLAETPVLDLGPLRKMPLKRLNLADASGVGDLRPIKGMLLETLYLDGLTNVDLALLSDMKSLRLLSVSNTQVHELRPLASLKLTSLFIYRTRLRPVDLGAISEMPLKRIGLTYKPEFAEVLRSFPHLETINDLPAAQFWKSVEKK